MSGSILVARRAGRYRAAKETQPNRSVAPATVTGSDALTPNTKLASALLIPNTPRIPNANPASDRHS
jgi:hypothetical protein